MAEKIDRGVNIYENVDAIRGEITEDTGHPKSTRLQPPELTGSDYVRIRCSRAAAVCLVLLCVLLLTAAIVRCVMFTQERKQLIQDRDQILIKITNFTEDKDQVLIKFTNITKEKDKLLTKITSITEEKDQLLTKITNLTEEKDQLLTKITNLTEENAQQLSKITNLTEEKDQLLANNTNLTKERDQLLTKITNQTEEKDQLLTKIVNLTREKDQLLVKITNLTEETHQLLTSNTNLTKERDQLLTKINNQTEERIQLISELLSDGWIYYQSSLYFISSEQKNWAESRRYCTERGADLIIINNEEHVVWNMMASRIIHVGYYGFWIGLTDSDEEGRWKWVDGTNMTSEIWVYGDPGQNCVVLTYYSWWYGDSCNAAYPWICVKSFLP